MGTKASKRSAQGDETQNAAPKHQGPRGEDPLHATPNMPVETDNADARPNTPPADVVERLERAGKLFSQYQEMSYDKDVEELFRILDLDGSGQITEDELQSSLRDAGASEETVADVCNKF